MNYRKWTNQRAAQLDGRMAGTYEEACALHREAHEQLIEALLAEEVEESHLKELRRTLARRLEQLRRAHGRPG